MNFFIPVQEKIHTTSAICMKTSTLFVTQAVAFALYENACMWPTVTVQGTIE